MFEDLCELPKDQICGLHANSSEEPDSIANCLEPKRPDFLLDLLKADDITSIVALVYSLSKMAHFTPIFSIINESKPSGSFKYGA